MFRQETVSNDETILVIGGPLDGGTAAEFHKKMVALDEAIRITT